MGDRIMTPERIEEIKRLHGMAIVDQTTRVERLGEENRRAIEVVCECSDKMGLLTGKNMQLTAEVERLDVLVKNQSDTIKFMSAEHYNRCTGGHPVKRWIVEIEPGLWAADDFPYKTSIKSEAKLHEKGHAERVRVHQIEYYGNLNARVVEVDHD
jgi:hypothetical protein